MKEIIKFNSSKEHYMADACVVWCFDDRFTNLLNELAKAENWKNYDLVKTAGGAKALSSPDIESEREFLLKQIKLSIKLHHSKKIVLCNHIDCGAFGGSLAFENEQKEAEFLIQELNKSKDFLIDNLENKTEIQLFLATFKGIFDIN